MPRGPAGAGTLNALLQEAIAPGREGLAERRYGARVFRPGDKVIQIRNNYDKGAAGVFNGTVTTSMNSTSCSTPTPSPCTAPRAANTRPWSCR